MAYTVNGIELETDDQGYLLEPDYSDEVVRVIAAAENIELTDAHWKVVAWLRDQYREHGHTPNFRNMLKGVADAGDVNSMFQADRIHPNEAAQVVMLGNVWPVLRPQLPK